MFIEPASGWAGAGSPNAITTPTARLSDSSLQANAFFGEGVALADTGDAAFITAPETAAGGVVDVFLKPVIGWAGSGSPNGITTPDATLQPPTGGNTFGDSVAVSEDPTLLIGGFQTVTFQAFQLSPTIALVGRASGRRTGKTMVFQWRSPGGRSVLGFNLLTRRGGSMSRINHRLITAHDLPTYRYSARAAGAHEFWVRP